MVGRVGEPRAGGLEHVGLDAALLDQREGLLHEPVAPVAVDDARDIGVAGGEQVRDARERAEPVGLERALAGELVRGRLRGGPPPMRRNVAKRFSQSSGNAAAIAASSSGLGGPTMASHDFAQLRTWIGERVASPPASPASFEAENHALP